MANSINPEELICARCGETRPAKFGNTRPDVEFEITPVEGLQSVYLCKICKDRADYNADMNEEQRQTVVYLAANQGQLTGPYSVKLYRHRIAQIKARTTT